MVRVVLAIEFRMLVTVSKCWCSTIVNIHDLMMTQTSNSVTKIETRHQFSSLINKAKSLIWNQSQLLMFFPTEPSLIFCWVSNMTILVFCGFYGIKANVISGLGSSHFGRDSISLRFTSPSVTLNDFQRSSRVTEFDQIISFSVGKLCIRRKKLHSFQMSHLVEDKRLAISYGP